MRKRWLKQDHIWHIRSAVSSSSSSAATAINGILAEQSLASAHLIPGQQYQTCYSVARQSPVTAQAHWLSFCMAWAVQAVAVVGTLKMVAAADHAAMSCRYTKLIEGLGRLVHASIDVTWFFHTSTAASAFVLHALPLLQSVRPCSPEWLCFTSFHCCHYCHRLAARLLVLRRLDV